MEEKYKLIEEILSEAKGYIEKGDAIQSSEKIYKVVEECIKLLSERSKLPEYEQAKKEGRWWSRLLVKAASKLARELNERKIEETWAIAFNLHVWGFHECALGIEEVKENLPYAEWLLDYTKNTARFGSW